MKASTVPFYPIFAVSFGNF